MIRPQRAWLWLAALLVSCNPRGTTRPRSGGVHNIAGLGIPYPIGEPETIEGWSRAALSRATFAVVMRTDDPGPFADRGTGPGPVMVGEQVHEAETQAFDALLSHAFEGRRPRLGSAVVATARDLAKLGYWPPAPSVFLVGPDSNCRAEVGAPTIGYYRTEADILQIDWALEGCDVDTAWGPVAVVTDRFPEDTVWVPAELGLDARYSDGERWRGPLASAIEPPNWSANVDAEFEIVRVLQIPDTHPTVVQVYDSLVRPDETDEARQRLAAAGLDPACADTHATEIAHGFWNGNALDLFAPGQAPPGAPSGGLEGGEFEAPTDEQVEPHLLGAFVRGEQIDGLVYDQRLDALVVIPPAPTMQGNSAWVRTTLPAGIHSDYARASWGYLPTSDASPIGDPCESPAR
ncbi:MAG: hypothetical protein JKY37_02530 [Nannocystaceae bacterium]|nr:hypothetical protein [Nannocystaceae bacterium]